MTQAYSSHTPSNHGNAHAAGLNVWFSHFAQSIAAWTGHPLAFMLAVVSIAVWIVTGPIFNYSDTWQLVINTSTTIVTFLMVFLIQNTQNRDMLAMQLKLSELVLAKKGVENKFASIEDLSDTELEELHDSCRARAETTERHLQQRRGAKKTNGNNKPPASAHRAKAKRAKSHAAARS